MVSCLVSSRYTRRNKMKLSHSQVLLLINTINPTVEYYGELKDDVSMDRYIELLKLQEQLEKFYMQEIGKAQIRIHAKSKMQWRTV
jgi:hypothetical protein